MHFRVFGRIKKLQLLILGQQRSVNSINKLLFYKFPSVKFIPQTFLLVGKFFNSFSTDTFSVCHISIYLFVSLTVFR